jgi:hypothetical protein
VQLGDPPIVRFGLFAGFKDARRCRLQLFLPRMDLARMDFKPARKLRYRAFLS